MYADAGPSSGPNEPMRLEVATVPRGSTYLHANPTGAHVLVHGGAARAAIEAIDRGIANLEAPYSSQESSAVLEALGQLFMCAFMANHDVFSSRPGQGEATTASAAGVVVRGSTACMLLAGTGRVHRFNRSGLVELEAPTHRAAIGHRCRYDDRPLTTSWQRGDVLVLSCGAVMDAPELILDVLASFNLATAARRIANQTPDAAGVVLVRWT